MLNEHLHLERKLLFKIDIQKEKTELEIDF